MERNLVLPAQPPYQETDVFEADKSQPYLEAKLYIERVEQDSKICQEENGIDRTYEPVEGPEPVGHGVSLTMYPIRVPSMHFTCATVQWDMPETPTEDPSLDSACVDELNSSGGASLDWTVNPLSSDPPSFSLEEDMIGLIPEEESGRIDTEAELQQRPAVTVEDNVSSCQTCDVQDTDENICETPSNEDTQVPCKDTSSLTSEAKVESGSLDFDNNPNRAESPICTEEIQLGFESPEPPKEENEQVGDTTQDTVSTQPEQIHGDECKDKEDVRLNLEDGDERDCTSKGEICVIVMADHEGDQGSSNSTFQSITNDQLHQGPDLLEELDPTHPHSIIIITEPPEPAEEQPECVCDSSETVETTDMIIPQQQVEITEITPTEQTERTGNSAESLEDMLVATLEVTSDDETLQREQLQHAETFHMMHGSAGADQQEEPTCEEQRDGLDLEIEQSEHSTKLEISEQPQCLDELEESEQSKQQDNLVDKTPSEKSEEDAQPSEIPNQPEQHVQSECTNETELLPPTDSQNSEETQESGQIERQETEQQRPINDEDQNKENKQSDCVEHHPEQSEQMHGSVEQLEEQKLESVSLVVPCGNSKVVEAVDQEEAKRLAERLYKLENFQRTDVVRHLDKDNEFSRAVGEEYLKFFDFTDQTLDEALRSFLLEVVLIGETQERERVLERFSGRYQECNPNTFTSPGSVLTLTCAVMLLNTDLHGQNVGKAMSSNDFVSNLDGMNEGENFSKDLLKTLYNSIKNHPLEWAVEEKELVKSMVLDQDSDPESSLRSKSNPFQDLAHDKKATVFQKGFLKRKAHADIDGKRTPWGKRSWKTFYAVLKGMVLYLQKNEYAKDWQSSEEVLSVHHSLAERAEDYTKRPHVFRLQTADWRVFLFEASSTEQMNSWIGRINLVSALYSSPPFPAAVGSQRKFCRPILPATQSALTLEKQLQSHAAMLQSFQEDLSALQQGAPEGRKAKARELEDLRHKEEYLQHERSRYEAYVQILEVWQNLSKSSETAGGTDLALFDQELWKGMPAEEDDIDEMDGGMKRSHSSPSLELELAPPPVVKVRRNISERRTYRKIVVPRRNKEL
ncbi:PH and SEC7 domain-containing protein 1-like [Astyanax mexicanus]|uniref:PH and SEC7 domain-containing protein 1-like n=1 Tax=Astyanax mexicanus TaxID=7994 RepID=A0A8B9JAW0_ASTMX|nr:PH and SEC7 domain-containing protein 1-like [Astyanax mexicanus]